MVGRFYTFLVTGALHPDEATRKHHEEMCFDQGWATFLDQLVASVKKL